MLKAITFDLDQTLIDFMHWKRVSSDAAAKAMVRAGLPMKVSVAKKKLFTKYIKDIESDTIFGDFLKENNSYDERILAAGINAYRRLRFTLLKPYPKVKYVLAKLKKYKLGIVTDASRLKAFLRLDAMGLSFDYVVGYEDTMKSKPSSFPFKKMLSLLKVKGPECLHVGDSYKDMAASKLGIITCLARYGSLVDIEADFVVDRFEDILKVVKRIENKDK